MKGVRTIILKTLLRRVPTKNLVKIFGVEYFTRPKLNQQTNIIEGRIQNTVLTKENFLGTLVANVHGDTIRPDR